MNKEYKDWWDPQAHQVDPYLLFCLFCRSIHIEIIIRSQGRRGERGSMGIQGATGVQGEQGIQGGRGLPVSFQSTTAICINSV